MKHVKVTIPSNQSFLSTWYTWTHGKVASHFKRNKERVTDTAQNVRLRLLSKDFIGRWFYKHLTNDLVTREQAEKILGGVQIMFVGSISPIEGNRSDPESLWLISDLLKFAKFNYERYFYSVQNHTIDSDRFLSLLGYPPKSYGILKSFYLQGRIYPSEFTEHNCSGRKDCVVCERGRARLKNKGISLADHWLDPRVECHIKALRWNDSQLIPFLRNWKKKNFIKCTPDYIVRPESQKSITAGLLKYASIIIDNEVVNDFKRMGRVDDLPSVILNHGMSPELSNNENIAYEGDDCEIPKTVLCDSHANELFEEYEYRNDVATMINNSDLTDEEYKIIRSIDLENMSVRAFSEIHDIPIPKVHRIHNSALRKIRGSKLNEAEVLKLVNSICDRYQMTIEQILESSVFGSVVVARTDLFSTLYDQGMGIEAIAERFLYSQERIAAAINRKCLQEMRNCG